MFAAKLANPEGQGKGRFSRICAGSFPGRSLSEHYQVILHRIQHQAYTGGYTDFLNRASR